MILTNGGFIIYPIIIQKERREFPWLRIPIKAIALARLNTEVRPKPQVVTMWSVTALRGDSLT